jgi:hypothetical protein
MLKIFIGYDGVESIAYHTLVQSIMEYTTDPVSITPIKKSMLPCYTRERHEKQSNEFSFTRFLVPYLCDYKGHALFIDCDQMFRVDVAELWKLIDTTKSVQVVKHDYMPSTQVKYLGAIQYPYPRKNWSSVMLFNCPRCKLLTPHYVNNASPMDLHRFAWTNDELIGELSPDWNHLVGEYDPNPDAKIAHWTLGGPWFTEYRDTEFHREWFDMLSKMENCEQLSEAKEA